VVSWVMVVLLRDRLRAATVPAAGRVVDYLRGKCRAQGAALSSRR
jgi:hypothetical protein